MNIKDKIFIIPGNSKYSVILLALSVFLSLSFSIVFGLFVIHENIRSQTREELIKQLSVEYPWTIRIAPVTHPSWVPGLFDKNRNLTHILERIYKAQEYQSDRLFIRYELGLSTLEESFGKFLQLWSQRLFLCQESSLSICDPYGTMPDKWTRLYSQQLITKMYFEIDGLKVRVSPTTEGKVTYCNLTPYKVNGVIAWESMSIDLVTNYINYGIPNIGDVFVESASELLPGECIFKKAYIYDSELYSYSFSQVIKDEVFEFSEREFRRMGSTIEGEKSEDIEYSVLLCLGSSNGVLYGDYYDEELRNCDEANAFPVFPTDENHIDRNKNISQALLMHPYVLQMSSSQGPLNKDQVLSDYQVSILQSISKKLGEVTERQYHLDEKWKERRPSFLLAADLSDPYGIFIPGVNFDNGREDNSYLDEYIKIPPSGTLQSINKKEVWSIYDVYDILDEHGNSRDAGIAKALSLEILGIPNIVKSRYIFNLENLPSFIDPDTTGLPEGFEKTFTYGMIKPYCGGLNNFLYPIVNTAKNFTCDLTGYMCLQDIHTEETYECVWRKTQQYAFAAQSHSLGYKIGDMLAVAVPVGAKGVTKLFAPLLAKSSRTVKILVPAAIEAADNVIASWSTAAPSLTPEEKMEMAKFNALFGLATGAGFEIFSPTDFTNVIRNSQVNRKQNRNKYYSKNNQRKKKVGGGYNLNEKKKQSSITNPPKGE